MKLTLAECQKLMAENNGNLDLRRTDITELPDGLVVEGDLELTNRQDFTKLPDNLTVEGELSICGSGIKKLPKNLIVKGVFNMTYTGITEIPDDCFLGGDVYTGSSLLKELPSNFIFHESLYLGDTYVKKFSDNLTIKGNFELYKIRTGYELSDEFDISAVNLVVGGQIRCHKESSLVNLAFGGYKINCY